jgi:transglutaminase-like putative cysteine protease
VQPVAAPPLSFRLLFLAFHRHSREDRAPVASPENPPTLRRSVPLLALLCVLAGGGIAAWKVLVLGWELSPRASADRWSIQLTVKATGRGERARLHLALPSGTALERVYDEQFTHPGLRVSVHSKLRGRTATFTTDAQQAHGALAVVYRFGAQVPREPSEASPAPPKAQPDDALPSATIPSTDPAIVAKARELNPTAADDMARVRGLYDFVLDEVAPEPEELEALAPEAVLTTLATLHGPPLARVRLFVALARSTGLSARIVRSVPLVEGTERSLVTRAEVLIDGQWTAVDPVRGRFGRDAEEGFPILRGDDGLARGEGLDDVQVTVAVARESVNEHALEERRAREGESLFDRLSFLALPPRTQLVFRVLLLVPLGALIVALFRNLVGVPTFGTFMPILIALALRETRPLAGLVLLGIVVGVGLVGRRLLERMRLLIVPRLALLLTFVIGIMAAVALLGSRLGLDDGLAIALLPMVIMTMTIERLSVTIAEEGLRSALRMLVGTVLVAAAGYAAIQSDSLQRLVFAFPELNLLVVAALLLLGRYTGYRFSELVRFRALMAGPAGAPAPVPSPSDPPGTP